MKKILLTLFLFCCFQQVIPRVSILEITFVKNNTKKGEWIYIVPKAKKSGKCKTDTKGNFIINSDGVVFIDTINLNNKFSFKLIDNKGRDISRNVQYFSSRVDYDNSISYFNFYIPSDKENKLYYEKWNDIEVIEQFTFGEIKREEELRKKGYNFW